VRLHPCHCIRICFSFIREPKSTLPQIKGIECFPEDSSH
jgi:hypothetical protein